MKLYKTSENNIINLDRVSLIYRDPVSNIYRVQLADGHIYEMPELCTEDIDKIMEYNNYLLDL